MRAGAWAGPREGVTGICRRRRGQGMQEARKEVARRKIKVLTELKTGPGKPVRTGVGKNSEGVCRGCVSRAP